MNIITAALSEYSQPIFIEFVKSVIEIQHMVKINSFRDAIAYQMMFSSGICQLLN